MNYSGPEIGTLVDKKNHSWHVAEMGICGKQGAGLDWHSAVYLMQSYGLGHFGTGKKQDWTECVAERGFFGLGSYDSAYQKSMTYFGGQ